MADENAESCRVVELWFNKKTREKQLLPSANCTPYPNSMFDRLLLMTLGAKYAILIDSQEGAMDYTLLGIAILVACAWSTPYGSFKRLQTESMN